MRKFAIIFLVCSSINVFAQAGRVKSETPAQAAETTTLDAEQMFREANEYARRKFADYEQKKIPFSEALRREAIREQKQLAAKYAAQIAVLNELAGADFFYLGMLHWLAESPDQTEANFKLFLASENPTPERAQTARSVLAVIAARRQDFETAEKFLKEYLSIDPVNLRERSRIEQELASGYLAVKNFERAAQHAETAFRVTKTLFQESGTRARGLAEILDSGRTVFEIYQTSGETEKADAALEELRQAAVFTESTGIYYFAVDSLVKYMIETNRKPQALAKFKTITSRLAQDFPNKPLQDELTRRFRRRDKHYALLGAQAPEIVEIADWIPGRAQPLASLRGKIVLLDFWATWCGPCIDTFPTLVKLYENHHKDGFEIVGLTRYYGQADGEPAPKKAELAAIENFKREHRLPYGFAVADGQANQLTYGATGIPTAVVIDRRGIIRYIESGTNDNREREIEAIVEKLLAEK